MGNEVQIEEAEREIKEMAEQIKQAAETEKDKAIQEVPKPVESSPEPEVSQASEAEPTPDPVTPPAPEKVTDDPLEWAKKKGLKTPEDMARLLRQKEQEYHQSRQKAPEVPPIPPQAPAWAPRPDMGYGYPPPLPYPGYDPIREIAAAHPQLDPEDVRKIMPLFVETSQAIARRENGQLRQEINELRRDGERNNELLSLMQDPAFTDVRVQKEINEILDTDKSAFQGPRAYTELFKRALESMARKQLQQGVTVGSSTPTNMPPVTAGGGNGSASAGPRKITQAEFDGWDIKDQRKYLDSKGRIIPKK